MKKKLTSRKFWVCVINIVVTLGTCFIKKSITDNDIALLATMMATSITYIAGESYIDGKNSGGEE